MRVELFGVRGSTPAPGADFVRYGGHTSCVALAHDGERPSLVLDGGTGIRQLARALAPEPFCGTVLLGHLHWDHVQGLPFFPAAAHPDSRTTVLLPGPGDADEVLGRAMSPPHFPIRPSELRGSWRFETFEAGGREVDGWSVLALEIPHGGGRTFGFRVSDGTATMAYLSDHSPTSLGPGPDGLGVRHSGALALAHDVDLLVHDSQHLAREFPRLAFLGHSTVEYAVELSSVANARALVLFHHDPDRTDDEVDSLVADLDGSVVPVEAAAEGRVFDLPQSGDVSERQRDTGDAVDC